MDKIISNTAGKLILEWPLAVPDLHLSRNVTRESQLRPLSSVKGACEKVHQLVLTLLLLEPLLDALDLKNAFKRS